jgi:hypothetical protein
MRLPRLFLLVPFLVLPTAACAIEASDDGDVGDEELAHTSDAITGAACSRTKILASTSAARKKAIERGFTWFDAKVPYSQSKSYKGYRTDCSGFVSMAWELGTSYTTASFSSGGGESAPLSSYDKLIPGDAIVRRSGGSGHIVLFLGWSDASKSGACVLEQASTASDMQFRVRTTASLKSGGYKAIRADKLAGDQGVSSPTGEPAAAAADPADDQEAPSSTTTPSGDGATCTSDGACNPGNDGAGMICQSGRCVAGCRQSSHCPGALTCVSGQCR